ncbi:unnamed protein product [Penicillium manginii]
MRYRPDRHSPLLDPSSPSGALSEGRDWSIHASSYGLPVATAQAAAAVLPSAIPEELFARDTSNLATLAVNPTPAPAMGSALDLSTAHSLTLNTRRPAAPTLPSFELPPPPFTLAAATNANANANNAHYSTNIPQNQPAAKWSSLPSNLHHNHNLPPASSSQPPANVSVGNLLTPPATIQSGESTVSHSLAPVSSSELPPTYWPGTPYGAQGTGTAGAGGVASWSGMNPAYAQRNSFSPSGMVGRSTIAMAPVSADGLSQPFETPSLTFPQALPAPPSSMALYQAHGHGHGHATSPAPLPSNDPYGTPKGPPMYGPSAHMPSPHQTGFSPMYGAPPAMSPAGLGIHPQARMSAQSPGGQPPLAYPRQPWPSYSLPAMNGPVMTNVHSPNSPMSMMGGMQPGLLPGFNSGHVASAQHLYGGHPPPHGMPAPAADRPFKCDQCPQSFNRNHDLKRHKRIHLAVKPFPCSHCDKSFSRKDALKRHILVKGCGKDGDSDSTNHNADLKGEGRSEDGSPVLNGRV